MGVLQEASLDHGDRAGAASLRWALNRQAAVAEVDVGLEMEGDLGSAFVLFFCLSKVYFLGSHIACTAFIASDSAAGALKTL